MSFVDDVIASMNELLEVPLSMAIMATMHAIGSPMAWHKTSIGHHSTWVGLAMILEYPCVTVAKDKLEPTVWQSEKFCPNATETLVSEYPGHSGFNMAGTFRCLK